MIRAEIPEKSEPDETVEREMGKKPNQTKNLFKDLLKGRPKAGGGVGSDNKRRLAARDLREPMKRSAWTFGVCLPAPDSENKERLVRPGSQPRVSLCYPALPGKTARALDAAGSPGRAMPDRRPGPRSGPRCGGGGGWGRGGGCLLPPRRLQKLWGPFIN